MVDLLGTNLHRHYFPLKTAESLVDWLLDTSGDRTKLPPPYRDIQRRT